MEQGIVQKSDRVKKVLPKHKEIHDTLLDGRVYVTTIFQKVLILLRFLFGEVSLNF